MGHARRRKLPLPCSRWRRRLPDQGQKSHSSRSFNGATFVRPPPATRWKDAGTWGRLPSATPPLASSARHKWHGRPRCAHIFLRALRAAESTGFGWRSDTVEHGDVVKIHYTGFLEDGSEFETTGGKDPLEFQVGAGRVVPGIEAAVVGMALGERRSATVACEDAFGYGVVNISIFEFPEPVKVGDRISVKGLFAVVKSVQDAWVEVDANHPLCGEDLYLDVQLVEVTKRSTSGRYLCRRQLQALELAFQRVDVVSTQVGYTQGRKDNPTYAEVCSGRTGHVEAVRAYFDPKVTYLDLLEVFQRSTSPSSTAKACTRARSTAAACITTRKPNGCRRRRPSCWCRNSSRNAPSWTGTPRRQPRCPFSRKTAP